MVLKFLRESDVPVTTKLRMSHVDVFYPLQFYFVVRFLYSLPDGGHQENIAGRIRRVSRNFVADARELLPADAFS